MLDLCKVDLYAVRRVVAELYQKSWNADLARPEFALMIGREGELLRALPPGNVTGSAAFQTWYNNGCVSETRVTRKQREIVATANHF